MDGKRSGGDEEPSEGERDAPPPTAAAAPESFGVVDHERLVKDDGRALIVFTRPPGR